MTDADLAEGASLSAAIDRLLQNPQTACLQAHYAKRGCYAAGMRAVAKALQPREKMSVSAWQDA